MYHLEISVSEVDCCEYCQHRYVSWDKLSFSVLVAIEQV